MPVTASSLSQICREIVDQLSIALNSGDDSEVQVILGNPSNAKPDGSSPHQVNVFYYQFLPFEYAADSLPDSVGYMRIHCLITPFGILDEGIGAGEHDLRILAEVVRIFQQSPVFSIEVNGSAFHIQVIMQSLGIEQISQLWGTQGDVVYRPSLAYEISLAPIVPSEMAVLSPLVGSLGLAVQPNLEAEIPTVASVFPQVFSSTVDSSMQAWQPRICWVIARECQQSLIFEVASPALASLDLSVWVAGEVGTTVALHWDVWDSSSGWQSQAAVATVSITEQGIDPQKVALATTNSVILPFIDHPGQAVLYAVRSYNRGADGVPVSVRSNPLLVNLYV